VRDFALVAGVVGPVHAAFIADLLHMSTWLSRPSRPRTPLGMFAMDVGRNYARSYITRARELDTSRVNRLYAEMEAEAIAGFTALGVDPASITFARTADLRYVGQFHEVEVPVPAGDLADADIATAIDGSSSHERRTPSTCPGSRWSCSPASVPRPQGALRAARSVRRCGRHAGLQAAAVAWWEGAPVIRRSTTARLRAGNEFHGPADEETTTTARAQLRRPWDEFRTT
jgi:N-methylhydantoinase A/oxoprolinase/acetone carboxylase beta subunit